VGGEQSLGKCHIYEYEYDDMFLLAVQPDTPVSPRASALPTPMIICPPPPRIPRGLLLLAAIAGLAAARGQDVPAASPTAGGDVTAVSGADFAREQRGTLADALGEVAGASVFASGQLGAPASLLLRGADSDETLLLVDGIRLNDANIGYGGFLGGAAIFPTDRIAVALGPQSTLYGSGAAGGIVALSTPEGVGAPSESIAAEAGSFSTVDASIAAQGAAGKWAYNAAAAETRTDNDRINNAFHGEDLALRLDFNAGRYAAVGATLRGFDSRYGDPGDAFINDPVAHTTEENWLGTLFANVELTQYVASRLTLGGQERSYDALGDPAGVSPLATGDMADRRGIVDWQNTIQMTQQDRLVAGVTAEEDTVRETGASPIDRRQASYALYGEDDWNPLQGVYLTGALRRDDTDTFGAAGTGRVTAALVTAQNALKLRGSYGTGFNAPSLLDLYGRSAVMVGNPALQPERSQGWDFGCDFYIPENQGAASLTWFRTDFENLIVDEAASPTVPENAGVARTRGVEVVFKTVLAGIFQTKLTYTRLEADNLTSATPLPLRPRYDAGLDIWSDWGRGFSLGAGAGWVGSRADVDAQTLADVYDPSYAVARIYAAWKINGHLTVKLRVENALDRQYEPINGYPALGTGIFGGAEWRF